MKSIVADYLKIVSQASIFSQGWLRSVNDWNVATTLRSSRGIDDDKLRAFVEIHRIDSTANVSGANNNKGSIKCIQSLTWEAKPSVYDISPSGRYAVSFFNSDKPYLEVCGNDEDGLTNSRLDISSLHGKFIADSWFGGLSWSTDERFLAYVAMKNDAEKSTYFSSEGKEGSPAKSKYDYNEDWGEKYDGVAELSLHVLDVLHMRVCTVSGIDATRWTVGQPCFLRSAVGGEGGSGSEGSDVLVYTAWNTLPRKLGMIYCYQRPCCLFAADLTQLLRQQPDNKDKDTDNSPSISHQLLTRSTATARSPRSNGDGSSLVFLGSEKGFQTHNGCSELFRIRGANIRKLFRQSIATESELSTSGPGLTDTIVEKIVAEVRNPLPTSEGEADISFPGIFADQLPKQCFLSSDDSVVMSTMWGSSESLIVVNLTAKSIERITGVLPITSSSAADTDIRSSSSSGSSSSSSILDVSGDNILLVTSSPTAPQQLCVYNCRDKRIVAQNSKPSKFLATKLKPLSASSPGDESLLREATNIADLRTRHFHHQTDGIPFDSMLLYPADATSSGSGSSDRRLIPIIVVPHGGPHSVTPTSFIASSAFLSLNLGAAILSINYRGSTGFGQDSIESLPGHIGRNDVDDIVLALRAVVDKFNLDGDETTPLLDMSRVSVVGGSHGGFLASHLIGQHPEIFKVACMRNPVTNIPSMVSVSDIPDWCFVEALGVESSSYDFASPVYNVPSEAQLVEMRKRSPVRYIDQVRAPTLLCLGAKDRRVPYSQGIEYYHLLRSRSVKTRLLIYPEDVHAIDRPATEAEQWVAIAEWIREHL